MSGRSHGRDSGIFRRATVVARASERTGHSVLWRQHIECYARYRLAFGQDVIPLLLRRLLSHGRGSGNLKAADALIFISKVGIPCSIVYGTTSRSYRLEKKAIGSIGELGGEMKRLRTVAEDARDSHIWL